MLSIKPKYNNISILNLDIRFIEYMIKHSANEKIETLVSQDMWIDCLISTNVSKRQPQISSNQSLIHQEVQRRFAAVFGGTIGESAALLR